MPFIESLISVINERNHQKSFGAKPQRLDPGLTIVVCIPHTLVQDSFSISPNPLVEMEINTNEQPILVKFIKPFAKILLKNENCCDLAFFGGYF